MSLRRCKKCGQEKTADSFYLCLDADGNERAKRFECKECMSKKGKAKYLAKPYRKWSPKLKASAGQRRKIKYETARTLVYQHYGQACACCGESERIFLTIDHINNDGNEHRKEVNGASLYQWLVKNDYPGDFQTLCRNCNWAKHANGGICPHQSQKVQRLGCEPVEHKQSVLEARDISESEMVI